MSISNGFVLKEDRNSYNEFVKGYLFRSRFEIWYVRRVLQLNIVLLYYLNVDV